MKRFGNLIAGKSVPSASGKWLPSLDPYRNENWCEIPDSNEADVNAAVKAARSAFSSSAWTGLTASAKGALLRRLGDLMATRRCKATQLMVIERSHGR